MSVRSVYSIVMPEKLSRVVIFFAVSLIMTSHVHAAGPAPQVPQLHWSQLAPLPDREGLASPFAGASGGALVVAGGANFPDKRPWEGGIKKWYDSTFILKDPTASWQSGPALPRPIAYGVSISYNNSLICIGGGDAKQHFAEVFSLQWDGQKLISTKFPDLPKPAAFMAGALAGDTVYIIGGIQAPADTAALNTLWSLDLTDIKAGWRSLPACPGGARILPVAASHDDAFYVFSGASLFADRDNKPARKYLRDAWRFSPKWGWKQLADLPRAAVAAPSPAPVINKRILIISGDDGENVNFKPEPKHPGFPRTTLAYDVATNAWLTLPSPISRATAPTVPWRNLVIIPNGEERPGYRSNQIWSVESAPNP